MAFEMTYTFPCASGKTHVKLKGNSISAVKAAQAGLALIFGSELPITGGIQEETS